MNLVVVSNRVARARANEPMTGGLAAALLPVVEKSGAVWVGSSGRVRDRMMAYAERHIAAGGRLQHVARHMVGLFTGLPGARRYRQILSTDAAKSGAGPEVLAAAFAAVDFSGTEQEAVSA